MTIRKYEVKLVQCILASELVCAVCAKSFDGIFVPVFLVILTVLQFQGKIITDKQS